MRFSKSQGNSSKYLFLNMFLINRKEQTMKYRSSWYRSVLAGIALLAGIGLFSTSALAQLTPSGTDITNTATLNYSVSGISQPAINSNLTTFKVDNLVRVVVVEANASHTPVAPGSTAQVTQFSVTNTGNTTQDYTLAMANLAAGATTTLGVTPYTDVFDGGACIVRVETDNVAGYNAGTDINTTIVSLAQGASKTVYVVCDIPTIVANPAVVNGADAIVSLTATTQNAATCGPTNAATCVPTAQTAGADTPGLVDVVFGDIAGTDDALRDGKSSARDVYRVVASVISVAKSVSVICDPFNLNTAPKAIPGAYVRYSITISNSAGAGSATLSTISDVLNANLNFDPDLIKAAGAVGTCAAAGPENAATRGFRLTCTGTTRPTTCPATGVFYTTANGDDAVGISGTTITAAFGGATGALQPEGAYAAAELKGGESVTITFNAIIK
jgi:hypothetical protein